MHFGSKHLVIFALMIVSCSCCCLAQVDESHQVHTENLTETIKTMDDVVFDAFNNRDVKKFKTLFTEDLEFYHDKDGLVSYPQLMESLQSLASENSDLKRELLSESLEVYPLKEYGAMQIGRHEFCHTENGQSDCGKFKFVHIWQNTDDGWKISRVISYDH